MFGEWLLEFWGSMNASCCNWVYGAVFWLNFEAEHFIYRITMCTFSWNVCISDYDVFGFPESAIWKTLSPQESEYLRYPSCWLCSRKYFVVIMFMKYSLCQREVVLSSRINKWENQALERLSNLLRVTGQQEVWLELLMPGLSEARAPRNLSTLSVLSENSLPWGNPSRSLQWKYDGSQPP